MKGAFARVDACIDLVSLHVTGKRENAVQARESTAEPS
jgi:hypothetical protein